MYSDIFEQLNQLEEDYLIEMANVRGKDCKVANINFSFYFSAKQGSHTIRAKVEWNRDHIKNPDGTILLFGNYEYIESNNCKNSPSQQDINSAREFFKKYKVLFAAVWNNCLDPVDLRNYFEGRLSFKSLIKSFYSIDNFDKIQDVKTIEELYSIVKKYNIFNLYDGELNEIFDN